MLALQHPHPRDALISFEEGPHIYTIKDDARQYTSVTTWLHKHFPAFEAAAIAERMAAKSHYVKTAAMIQAEWKDAAALGTALHLLIENYYNGAAAPAFASAEFTYFLNFVETIPHLKPYRTEWMIFDENLVLAGSIDMVYAKADGTFAIYDWKRTKEIKKSNAFGGWALTDCIAHLPDSNYWHYALQLNTYKTILERNYNMCITELCLVVLHPLNANKNFQVHRVPILQNEMEALCK